ncbi:MAG TPA: 3-hydroxyacyl-CoA dehydrogenase family protein, partial [Frankiaceae bacterium]|nr:3-hydroxyacyl-CoA dehydrogenase family protein [Frankiaceae bacterium]
MVGLGNIGSGIAEVLAGAGIQVVAVETDQACLERGMTLLHTSTDRAVGRGKMTPEQRAALVARIEPTLEHAKLAGCELVLESISERLDAKRALFDELDRLCPPETIFATNTSSLSVTELAALTKRPSRFVGIHFFNPAPVMGLVEVIQTVVTAPAVLRDVEALVERVGKIGVTVGDRAGFIANALLFPYLNSAIRMYEARFASREDIDAAMRFGAGHPMGPLSLLDLIGLDTALLVLDTMYHQTRDHLHAPAPLL